MSSAVSDTVPKVNSQEEAEETPVTEQSQRPQDGSGPESSETPKDAPLTSSIPAVTNAGNEELSTEQEHTKKEEKTLTVPATNTSSTGEKPKVKPAADSTRSKNSSLTKTLSNGKLFSKKAKGDGSKQEGPGPVAGKAAGAGDESELKKKDKKKKRGTIWRFLNSCFTPSISHTALDDSLDAKSASSVGAATSAKGNKSSSPLSEKKTGDHIAEASVGSATLVSSNAKPASRRSSAIPLAADEGGRSNRSFCYMIASLLFTKWAR